MHDYKVSLLIFMQPTPQPYVVILFEKQLQSFLLDLVVYTIYLLEFYNVCNRKKEQFRTQLDHLNIIAFYSMDVVMCQWITSRRFLPGRTKTIVNQF